MIRKTLSVLVSVTGLLLAGVAARADVLVTGDNPFYVLDASDGLSDGVFNVAGNLTLDYGALIHCYDTQADQPSAVIVDGSDACPITIVATGDLLMQPNSAIEAENRTGAGAGGDITITVGGSMTLLGPQGIYEHGAFISSRKTSSAATPGSGGDITMHAGDTTCTEVGPQTGDISVDVGVVITSEAPMNAGDIEILAGRDLTINGKVTSNNRQATPNTITNTGRAGRITTTACCDLLIGANGIVTSRGGSAGADLVHVEGCSVQIAGLVESTGPGNNDNGTSDANACNDANHSGLPSGAKYRACIEVWSGSTILIDASDTSQGQVNADSAQSGSNSARSWIDMYANGKITVFGNEIDPFAVHANQTVASGHGGVITVKSKGNDVVANNLAFQADATGNLGAGGQILVEATSIDLTGGSVYARGDADSASGIGKGGSETVRAYTGSVSWPSGTGDVQPTGTGIALGNRGVISLYGCPVTTGASFPFTLGAASTPTTGPCAVGSPAIPDPAGSRLMERIHCDTVCDPPEPPDHPFFCKKDPVRTILDPANGRFPLNQGPDVIVRTDLGESIQAAVTAAAAPGYDAAHNNDGYVIIAVSAQADGSLGGNTTQEVDITGSYEFPFALIGCSVTMHDPTPGDGNPTGHVAASATSPENPPLSGQKIFLMDLHAADSGVAGWKIEGDGRYVRNTYGNTSGAGIWFVGNNNVMHNGNGSSNTGDGIRVNGDGNLVESADAFYNGGDGVRVSGNGNQLKGVDTGDRGKGNTGDGINLTGNSNSLQENDCFGNGGDGIQVAGSKNTLLKNHAGDSSKGNGGDGINVAGSGNLLQENTAYLNVGDGFEVSGGTAASPNTLLKNKSGDKGKANGGNGFYLHDDTGNGNTNPIELQENTAKSNAVNGFLVTSAGHQLKSNQSGGGGSGEPNGVCQYNVAAGNFNATGNKSNGVQIPGANGSAFPTGCQ